MKALSIRQPWAWLIVNGHKAVENRSWSTDYRGPLVIHAGKAQDLNEYHSAAEVATGPGIPAITIPAPADLDHGGVVGMVDLVDIVTESRDPWFFGPFGWVFTNPRPLPFVKYRGQQCLFTIKPKEAPVAQQKPAAPTKPAKPWILCFVSKRERDKKARGGVMLTVDAIAQDGTTLHQIKADDLVQARKDIGVDSAHMDELYKKHYPDGFYIEWIDPSKQPKDANDGKLQDLLLAAIKKGEGKADQKGAGSGKEGQDTGKAGESEQKQQKPADQKKGASKKKSTPPAKGEPSFRERTRTMMLPVPVTRDELLQMWNDRDDLEAKIEALELELDRNKAEIKVQITEHLEEIGRIKKAARKKQQDKPVVCKIEYDWESGFKVAIRIDTGEQVWRNPITHAEQQEAFDLKGKAPGQDKPKANPTPKPEPKLDPKATKKPAGLTLACETSKAVVEAIVEGEFKALDWRDLKAGMVFKATLPDGQHLWPAQGRRFRAAGGPTMVAPHGWAIDVEVVEAPDPGKPAPAKKDVEQAAKGVTKPGASETKPGPSETEPPKSETKPPDPVTPSPVAPIAPRDPKKVVRLGFDSRFAVKKREGQEWPEKPFAGLLPGDVVRFVNRETGEIAGGKDWKVLSAPKHNTANQLEVQIEAEEPKAN